MKIGIIGSGYVGLVTGACFAHLGHRVLCVDSDLKKISMLRKGKSPIYEPGLEKMLHENIRRKRLSFATRVDKAVRQCEILFICVNTPPKLNGEADLSFVENVSQEIAENLTEYRLIVEKSTVPVQTGEWIQKTVHQICSSETLFDVASNPEFLREGSAIHDFLNPDRVILGVSSARAEKILRKLYAPFKTKVVFTDLKSAEIIKHASNSFLATKISFINAVAQICDAAGADVQNVALGMGLDPRIGPSFLKAGIGFGGFCFPKDLAAFLRMSERLGVRFDLLQESLNINEQQKRFFIQKIESRLWNLTNKTLAVLGLSFKPNTDDIRYAPAVDIIQLLQKENVKIRVYDPQAMPKARYVLRDVTFCKGPYEAARGSDALLIMTEWNEFSEIDFNRMKKLLKQPVVFDGRNMLDPVAMKKMGFRYCGIGRGEA
jgi:UDPglucose 6-dehydrogenase